MTAVARLRGKGGADYDWLSGVSGSAFRVQIGEEGWVIYAPFATAGFDCSEPAAAALGWKIDWSERGEDGANTESVREAIVTSIDAGLPALLSREECSIITGYEAGGGVLVIRQVGAGEAGYTTVMLEELEGWHDVGVIEEAGPEPDRRDSVLAALQLAVRLNGTERHGDLASGQHAYRLWAERLENVDGPHEAHSNGYAYCCLDTKRFAATKFLRMAADELGGEAGAHVESAADIYQQIVDTLREKRDELPEPWMLFPWDLDRIGGWTREHRHAQAKILREIAALEAKGIAEIVEAREAEGIEVGDHG